LAFAIPYGSASDFLVAMREISTPEAELQGASPDAHEEKKWIMKAAKSGTSPGGIRNWMRDSWTSFVDLLKVGPQRLPACETNGH
jgi:hydroxymethylglutaryl-CoA reductase (NADPH)